MRELNIPEGIVLINNDEGPCPSCLTAVEEILLTGQTLIVYWQMGSTTICREFNGKASN